MKILWHQENMPHMNVRKNKGVTYLTWPEFEKFRVLYTGSAPGLEESVRGFILL